MDLEQEILNKIEALKDELEKHQVLLDNIQEFKVNNNL